MERLPHVSPVSAPLITLGRGVTYPRFGVPTGKRTPKAVAVKAETEEPHTLKLWSSGTSLKGHALTLWPLKQGMKSLLQAKYRPTLIIKCFRYNLYITGSHFRERFTNIAKIGGGNLQMANQKRSKSQNLGW